MMRLLAFFVLLASLACAASSVASTTAESGYFKATGDTSTVHIFLTTDINSMLVAVQSKPSYAPGETAVLTLTKNSLWAYNGVFSATSSAVGGASATSSPNNANVAVNFNSGQYDALMALYNKGCRYWSDPTVGLRCVNANTAGTCAPASTGNPRECDSAFPGGNTGQRTIHYYKSVTNSLDANGELSAVCKGTIYMNGSLVGSIDSVNSISVPIPANAVGTYLLAVEMRYQCFFVLNRLYSAESNLYPTYYTQSEVRVTEYVQINITCPERVNITIDSITNPINLNSQMNGQAQVSMTIRNNGNVSATVTSIVPSLGSYSGISPSLPITLQPNQAVTVSGTYTYPGTLTSPTTVRFTVTASGTECGKQVTRTAFRDVTVNPPTCSENVGLAIDSIVPNPIDLPTGAPGSTATVTLAVRNTGTNTVNITSVGVTAPDTFSKTSPTGAYPLPLTGGSTMNIIGTYTYNGVQLNSGQSVSRTFTVSGAGALCGTPLNAQIGATVRRAGGPPSCTLAWNPAGPITAPGSSIASWSLTNAVSATYVCTGPIPGSGSLPVDPPAGSATFNFDASQTGTEACTITVTNSTGQTGTCSATLIVNPAACSENVGIAIDSVNPITLSGTVSGSTGTTTVRVRNTGTDAINLSSITVTSGNGYFTISSPTLPVQIAGGGYIDVSGTYTYTGSTLAFGQQISVTFLASGIGAKCGTPLSASRSTTATAPSCAETASISLVATNPITLNSSNQSQVTLTVTNTGNVAVTIAGAASITVNRGTFVPSSSFPITINPGVSANINGVYTYNGATPTTVTFTVSASATECGTQVTRSASYTSNVNKAACNESASISLVATNPITLNSSNQSQVTLTVTNTGNVAVTVPSAASITTDRGTLAPSGPFPITINPGLSANINGVYTYNGATPTTVTFTVSASATECGTPVTRSASYTSSINSCSYAGIEIVGVMPPAIVFDNRSADIEITVRNNGSAAMNVTAFNVSGTRFRLTIDDALPLLMNAGEVYVFNATLEYTGSDEPPSSVTIRVFATTRLPVCGPNTANASITVPIPAKGDLEPEIFPAKTAMNQTESSSANITVRNRGAGNITESTILMVRIMHCSAMFMGSCQIESEDNYTIGELDEGENETIVSADYQCEGYRYVGIRATANAEGLPVEDNFANNNDTVFIPCSRERCEVSGPDEMRLPGEYRFNVSCFDSDNNEQNCTSGFVVVPPGFSWDYAFPAGAITCSPASCIPVTEGDANENSSIYVSNILMNGTLSVTAKATTQLYHQEINCTAYVQIYPNPCRRQI